MRIIINYALRNRLLQAILIINAFFKSFLTFKIKEYNLYGLKRFSPLIMNSNKFCLNCGSSTFVSDRSLGGKMVCLKCGSSLFGRKTLSQINNKKIIFFVIATLVVFIIII